MPESFKPAVDPHASLDPSLVARMRLSPAAERWHKPVFIMFLVVWAVNWVVLLLRVELPPEGRWIEALLPVLAAFTSLLALGRRLPLQNVLMAGALIAGLSIAIVAVGALSGVPFGPVVYSDAFGERFFGVVPWPMPLLWIALVVSGRGVARLIMRPWRKTNFYGYWVIGFACLLAVLFDLGLEPFAVQVKGWWIWLSGKSVLSWHTAPWVNSLGWLITALALIIAAIPWLINKQPVKQPTDYHPLVVWLLLNLWLGTGNALQQMWLPVGVALLGNILAAIYAVRGARW